MKNHRMMRIYLLAIVTAALTLAQNGKHEHEWAWEGEAGPLHWADLKPEYATCKTGKEQSPIDIRNPRQAALPAIHFDYKASPLKIIDNSHTIQVNYAPGSFITVGDHRYQLLQFHFHRPSEERIQGKSYQMVAHLVHADSEGKLAVVAVLLEKGTANSTIQEIWDKLPKTQGKEETVPGVEINASGLLPKNTAYYTYPGSLTTPPCTEGVTWLILKTPVDLSSEQIDTFAKIYPHNARPIQPLGDRVVKASK
jgi:carbonic anhydrase